MFKSHIGAVVALATFLALSASQPASPGIHASAGNGYIYSAQGRLVGHIERTSLWDWDVSDHCNSVIEMVTYNERMLITEGFHHYAFAKYRSSRRWDIYSDARQYMGTVRRARARRWDVYRGGRRLGNGVYAGGRRIGHTTGRGLDPVAAGFAYIFWFRSGCFDL